jgi:hypothetical protein
MGKGDRLAVVNHHVADELHVYRATVGLIVGADRDTPAV